MPQIGPTHKLVMNVIIRIKMKVHLFASISMYIGCIIFAWFIVLYCANSASGLKQEDDISYIYYAKNVEYFYLPWFPVLSCRKNRQQL